LQKIKLVFKVKIIININPLLTYSDPERQICQPKPLFIKIYLINHILKKYQFSLNIKLYQPNNFIINFEKFAIYFILIPIFFKSKNTKIPFFDKNPFLEIYLLFIKIQHDTSLS